jgi:dolichol-phosphate mannosyltransferase
MRTLVVIPTYLEAENVADVLRRVRAAAPNVDILVVDDNSADGTADLARAVAEELGQVDVLVRPDKGGLGVAYRAGFELGFERGYDVLVQMDADLSHDPAKLPELLAEIENGADVAIGSRYVAGGSTPQWPKQRRMLSRIGNFYASRMLGLKVNDATAGFRAYRGSLLARLEADSTRATGYGFQVELIYRAHRLGAVVREVPITFNDRVRGVSKMSWHIIGEAMSLVTWWGVRDRVADRLPGRAVTPAVPTAETPADLGIEDVSPDPPAHADVPPAAPGSATSSAPSASASASAAPPAEPASAPASAGTNGASNGASNGAPTSAPAVAPEG